MSAKRNNAISPWGNDVISQGSIIYCYCIRCSYMMLIGHQGQKRPRRNTRWLGTPRGLQGYKLPSNWIGPCAGLVQEIDIYCNALKVLSPKNTHKKVLFWMFVASWCSACFCADLCDCFCMSSHFIMVALNLTSLHCLQHSFFEHLFNLYYQECIA